MGFSRDAEKSSRCQFIGTWTTYPHRNKALRTCFVRQMVTMESRVEIIVIDFLVGNLILRILSLLLLSHSFDSCSITRKNTQIPEFGIENLKLFAVHGS